MTSVSTYQASEHHDAHGHDHNHDSGTRTTLGFWIYLMSDCLIFATLFATFGVLANATAGGPTGKQLFELPYVLGETLLLLASSFTFGMGMLSVHANQRGKVIGWLAATFVLGAAFIGMEIYEFAHLIHDGAGLLWIVVMMHHISRFGLTPVTRRRIACLSLFWHFLDLVWICVFSLVYLREFL